MNIVINIVELSSTLALNKITEEILSTNQELTEEDVEKIIYQEQEGSIIFREEFQTKFEQYYDEFWELVEKAIPEQFLNKNNSK